MKKLAIISILAPLPAFALSGPMYVSRLDSPLGPLAVLAYQSFIVFGVVFLIFTAVLFYLKHKLNKNSDKKIYNLSLHYPKLKKWYLANIILLALVGFVGFGLFYLFILQARQLAPSVPVL